MADALDFLENLEQLDMKAIAIESFRTNERIAADLNATQMAQGRRATGTEIKPEYHPLTIELKRGRGGLAGVTDRVTLYDTGSHYRELYAEIATDGQIEYGSRDEKSEKLQTKYGAIYGLNEDSMGELIEGHLEGTFNEKTHEALGL